MWLWQTTMYQENGKTYLVREAMSTSCAYMCEKSWPGLQTLYPAFVYRKCSEETAGNNDRVAVGYNNVTVAGMQHWTECMRTSHPTRSHPAPN